MQTAACWKVCRASVLLLAVVVSAQAQTGQSLSSSPNLGSVPSGPPTNGVLHLTLQDAIDMAVRYNLGIIESGENVRDARGQRLRALSGLMPQIGASGTENVEQISAAAFGIKASIIPSVIGPFSYTTIQATLNQTLFSFESIQRFRAARTGEETAMLTYDDTLDVITLTVGAAYLQVVEASSRIEAAEAQVRNAEALYNQAVDTFQAGTSPKIDVTRTSVQLHTEQYNLSIARNNFAIAKLNLSRAIGLPNRHPTDRASRQELTMVIPDPKLDVNTELSARRYGMSFQRTPRVCRPHIDGGHPHLSVAHQLRLCNLPVLPAAARAGSSLGDRSLATPLRRNAGRARDRPARHHLPRPVHAPVSQTAIIDARRQVNPRRDNLAVSLA